VHRDIKPENIVISENLLRVHIIDFDIVTPATDTETEKGTFSKSTAGYYPEIKTWSAGDLTWDWWAFVLVVFELRCCRILFLM
jgi:serine/threonine protein kinase